MTDFKAANPDGDTTIEKAEFSKACDNGLVKSGASSGASSGEAGTAARRAGSKKYKQVAYLEPRAHSTALRLAPRSDALASPLGRPIACCAQSRRIAQRASFSTAAARGAK